MSFSCRFEGIRGLNETFVRRERIWLLSSTVRERVFAKGFRFNTGNAKRQNVCRKLKLPGRGLHSKKVSDRQGMSQRRYFDRQLTVCNLFWLGPVTSEELGEVYLYTDVCVQVCVYVCTIYTWCFLQGFDCKIKHNDITQKTTSGPLSPAKLSALLSLYSFWCPHALEPWSCKV